MNSPLIHRGDIADSAQVPASTTVWDHAQVRERAVIGPDCIIDRGAYIGIAVIVGKSCKTQNNALIYEPAQLGDGVFIGPAAVLTNDLRPRAVNLDLTRKTLGDWRPVGVTVHDGASIGAGAVCVAPITIGAWAMIGAGSVVLQDVPSHALVVGTPARQIGWVGRTGTRLKPDSVKGFLVCPDTGIRYEMLDTAITEIIS